MASYVFIRIFNMEFKPWTLLRCQYLGFFFLLTFCHKNVFSFVHKKIDFSVSTGAYDITMFSQLNAVISEMRKINTPIFKKVRLTRVLINCGLPLLTVHRIRKAEAFKAKLLVLQMRKQIQPGLLTGLRPQAS